MTQTTTQSPLVLQSWRRYESTRGGENDLHFREILMAGLATDGGLYMPSQWPQTLDRRSLHQYRDKSYSEIATNVMNPFIAGAFKAGEFANMVERAYSCFTDPKVVCPLIPLWDNLWLLDLTQGPTLAFKDVALQLLGELADHVAREMGIVATILVATSGDTGSAAIEAARGRKNLRIIVLHPAGRVSDVQRRQMTTVIEPNVLNIAIGGTFDDCQDLVKALFADPVLCEQLNLMAMNSINWTRVMAQIVYYVTAVMAIGGDDPVNFAVPTGNFGNIFAGFSAAQMGLPIGQLLAATNSNDVLADAFLHAFMDRNREVIPTISPSMDIQVSSNFERLLYCLLGRDGAQVGQLMASYKAMQRVQLPQMFMDGAAEQFCVATATEYDTRTAIVEVYQRTGRLIDPHSAVGIYGAQFCDLASQGPTVCLATADPAKFPAAVEAATSIHPPLPERMADLLDRPEKCVKLANDLEQLKNAIHWWTAA